MIDDLMSRAGRHGLIANIDSEPHMHAALLLLIASVAASDPDDADKRQRGRAMLDALLGEAVHRGFVQAEALRALLERGDFGERTFVLAKAAMADVDAVDLAAALVNGGFPLPEVDRD